MEILALQLARNHQLRRRLVRLEAELQESRQVQKPLARLEALLEQKESKARVASYRP